MIFFPLSARRLLRSLSSYMTAGSAGIMIDACVWGLRLQTGFRWCVYMHACVCERERETWEAHTEKNTKGFKNPVQCFFNILASASLRAPGQDILSKYLGNFRNVGLAGLLLTISHCAPLWTLCLSPLSGMQEGMHIFSNPFTICKAA